MNSIKTNSKVYNNVSRFGNPGHTFDQASYRMAVHKLLKNMSYYQLSNEDIETIQKISNKII